MTDESERERIREEKRRELLEQHQPGSGASAGGSQTPDKPLDIRDQGHFQQVLGEYHVVLVDCYADWCGPCKMMEPAIEALAAETDAAVAKVDVDANKAIAAQLGAQSIPTLVVFVDGEPAERLIGAQDKGRLKQVIERVR